MPDAGIGGAIAAIAIALDDLEEKPPPSEAV